MSFDYPAKSGVQRILEIEDARSLGQFERCYGAQDEPIIFWHIVIQPAGRTCTPKISTPGSKNSSATNTASRIWHATVLAADSFACADPAAWETRPAVARSAYVDPRVTRAYEHGNTIEAAAVRAARGRRPGAAQKILDKATRSLIRRAVNHHTAREVAAAA